MVQPPKKIIISRTDSIGDVILTLPMAGILKETFPNTAILFLGKTYTKPIVALSKHVNEFINWDEIKNIENPLTPYQADCIIHVFPNKVIAKSAKQANITTRIGTARKVFHLGKMTHYLNFTRKKSKLHESQLNLKLLSPLGIKNEFLLDEIYNYLGFEVRPSADFNLPKEKFKLILHPKSKGSAVEWGVENYLKLVELLPSEKFELFVSGTDAEKPFLEELINHPKVNSICGKYRLEEFIQFIQQCDGLIAASTGPLHIAATLNKHAFGFYSNRRPIHPGRWQPLGKNVHLIRNEQPKTNDLDAAVKEISPEKVAQAIFAAFK